jgi:hypothetical protein
VDLTALQTRCSTRFRDPDNEVVSDAEWTGYLNDAYRDVQAASAFWPWMEAVVTSAVTVTAGNQYVALPTDVSRIQAIRNRTDDLAMRPIPGRTLHLETFPEGSTVTGTPTLYRVAAKRLYVYPTPTADTVFDLEYPVAVADLSAGADEPAFPEQYHHALVEGALSRAYVDDGAPEQAAGHLAAFDGILGRMLTDLLGAPRADHYPAIVDDWY